MSLFWRVAESFFRGIEANRQRNHFRILFGITVAKFCEEHKN